MAAIDVAGRKNVPVRPTRLRRTGGPTSAAAMGAVPASWSGHAMVLTVFGLIN
jgi:hypothetical protein